MIKYAFLPLKDLSIAITRSTVSISRFTKGSSNIKNAGFDAVGYDGNPYTPELTEGFGKVLDLTRRYDLEKKFDWVQSF